MALKTVNQAIGVGSEHGLTNGGKEAIETSIPYVVRVELTGACDLILHRYNEAEVKVKTDAVKGSKAKKTDNLESYVYRNDDGFICLPGSYVRGTIVNAAKFKQDPRSPRKSAMDLYKAGIVSLTPLATLGVKDWAYEFAARVVLNKSAITRVRPAIKSGWKAEHEFLINLPEYISIQEFHDTLNSAGRLVGVGDFRPTYGRFNVSKIEVLTLSW